MYFKNQFPSEFEVVPKSELINSPVLVRPSHVKKYPKPSQPLSGTELNDFIKGVAEEIAQRLKLNKARN